MSASSSSTYKPYCYIHGWTYGITSCHYCKKRGEFCLSCHLRGCREKDKYDNRNRIFPKPKADKNKTYEPSESSSPSTEYVFQYDPQTRETTKVKVKTSTEPTTPRCHKCRIPIKYSNCYYCDTAHYCLSCHLKVCSKYLKKREERNKWF